LKDSKLISFFAVFFLFFTLVLLFISIIDMILEDEHTVLDTGIKDRNMIFSENIHFHVNGV
jgi:hypothetical protein